MFYSRSLIAKTPSKSRTRRLAGFGLASLRLFATKVTSGGPVKDGFDNYGKTLACFEWAKFPRRLVAHYGGVTYVLAL